MDRQRHRHPELTRRGGATVRRVDTLPKRSQPPGMSSITIRELHEHTEDWVRKEEAVRILDQGEVVAILTPVPCKPKGNPFRNRRLLPGYAAIMHKSYGGTDSTEIVSEMRDGR